MYWLLQIEPQYCISSKCSPHCTVHHSFDEEFLEKVILVQTQSTNFEHTYNDYFFEVGMY